MKILKQFLLISMLILLTLSVYAGGEKEKTEPEAAERYKITLNAYNMATPEEDAWVLKYWEEKLNIDIEYIYLENNKAEELLNLRLASGDEPDTWCIAGNRYASLGRYIDEDLIAQIPDDMMRTYAPDIVKALDDTGEEAWAAAKVGDKIYNLPELRAHNLFAAPVVWRDDWLRKAGISQIPVKLEDAEKAFYAFRNDDPDGNGKKDTYALSKTGLNVIYGAFGYMPFNWSVKDGKLVYGAVEPEMKAALSLLAKWYQDGLIDPEFVTGENKGGYWALTHDFINGRIGFTNTGCYYHWKPDLYEGDVHAGQNQREFYALNPEGSLALGKPLIGPGGKSGTNKGDLASPRQVFAKRLEKQPGKFAKILQLFNDAQAKSKENYLLTFYGKEGEHWEMIDGKPKGIGKYNDLKEQAKIGGHTIIFSTFPLDYSWITYPGWDKWGAENCEYKNFYVQKLKAPLPSDSKYLAELNKLKDGTYINIIAGSKPVDFFDTFVKEWMSSGGEQLIKEANEWYSKK